MLRGFPTYVTCGEAGSRRGFTAGCGGRVLSVLATCVAWMCARLRLGLARPALPARGCAVPVAPPSATTTQQGEHVLVRASAGITLRSLLSLPPPRLAIPAPQSPHDSSFHGVVPPFSTVVVLLCCERVASCECMQAGELGSPFVAFVPPVDGASACRLFLLRSKEEWLRLCH